MDNTLEIIMNTEMKKKYITQLNSLLLFVLPFKIYGTCMTMLLQRYLGQNNIDQHSLTHRNRSWLAAVWSVVAQGFCFQNRCSQDLLLIHSVHCSIAPNTNRQTVDQSCTVAISKEKNSSLIIGVTELEILKTEIFCYKVTSWILSPHLIFAHVYNS